MGSHALRSALLMPVPEAEGLVGPWRERYDQSAAKGLPAHITLVFPFLPAERLSRPVLDELGRLLAAPPSFRFRMRSIGRFPETLYLVPEPAEPFRSLTNRVWKRWPEAPPYEGEFDHVIPHLTVADRQPPEILDRVAQGLGSDVTVMAVAREAWLMVEGDDHRWQLHTRLPLGPGE